MYLNLQIDREPFREGDLFGEIIEKERYWILFWLEFLPTFFQWKKYGLKVVSNDFAF